MKKDLTQVQKINSGDLISFKSFFEEMYSSLLRYACNFIPENEQSEDIVQDVFLKFWKMRKNFNSISSAKSYLYKTVKNSCLNFLRHQKLAIEYSQNNFDNDFFTRDFIIEEEVHNTIHKAIDMLPIRSQKTIKLVLEGLKNPEIAEQMNISVNTVKTLKQAAYKKLRDNLRENLFVFFLLDKLIMAML